MQEVKVNLQAIRQTFEGDAISFCGWQIEEIRTPVDETEAWNISLKPREGKWGQKWDRSRIEAGFAGIEAGSVGIEASKRARTEVMLKLSFVQCSLHWRENAKNEMESR